MNTRYSGAALVLALVGCDDDATRSDGDDGEREACVVSRTDEIRQGLEVTCGGCHSATANRPFFADLRAFEQLIAYDERYVVRGSPEDSRLLALLEGTASGQFRQMPPTGPTFAEREAMDGTAIGIADVADWITDLPEPPPELVVPNADAPTTRRLTADEIAASLRDQLGLTEADFIDPGSGYYIGEHLGLLAPDAVYPPTLSPPGVAYGVPSYGWPTTRFSSLGGAHTLAGQPKERALTPSSGQVLVQVSQAWCSLSVQKADSPLLAHATLADTLASNPTAIAANIEAMGVRMLGQVDPEDIDAMTQLFGRLESEGPEIAWTAVCAAYVRHPRWMAF